MPDTDRFKGKAKEAAGTVEKKAGEITGDQETEARGEGRREEGKAQNLWGETKDTARDAKDAVEEHLRDH